ncbi:MAG: COX15/CtaA family protein [Anaerolineales bacterium]|jgi:heme A synthase
MSRFSKFAWTVLGFNILVILWGALVRATGSGAGCGSHWPSCNGQVIPLNPQIDTTIEFTHRLMSGVSLLLVIGLFIWAARSYERGHIVRQAALFSVGFIFLEALIGAGLVLFELVADNDSVARVLSIALHLANTFLLLASLTLTAWWSSWGKPVDVRRQGALPWLFLVGLVGIVLLGMSGAVTALGDTLFPVESLQQGLAQDFSGTAHFLIQLRIVHPVFAIIVGIYLLVVTLVAVLQRPDRWTKRFTAILLGLFFIQLLVGVMNVVLLAPITIQLVHLLLADAVWILFILLAASALSQTEEALDLKETNPSIRAGSSVQGI